MAVVKNEYEEVAQRVASKVLGVSVSQYDTGSSVPDLRIDYRHRPAGYIEVVSDNSKPWRSMQNALRRGQNELLIPDLEYNWWVWPKVTARIMDMRLALPALLRQLEDAGETFEHRRPSQADLQRRIRVSPFYAEIDRVGISEIVAEVRAAVNAVVHLNLPGAGGPAELDIDRVVEWCGEFLAHADRQDVRRKLADTNAVERHAFVVVTLTSEWAVQHLLTHDGDGQLPDRPPDLPDEITHLWLLGTECADRCIAWLPDRGGWIDYAVGPWHR